MTAPSYTGDELLPEANVVFDRTTVLDAAPEQVWPWLVQLGKRRAGWYLPERLERLLPAGRRASRRLEPRWQKLGVGERIPDYGGQDAWLEVALIEAPKTLVYRSQRNQTRFTWALLLEPEGNGRTRLRLRFRGQLRSTGMRRRVIVTGGDFFDWSTEMLMVAGLKQRIAQHQ